MDPSYATLGILNLDNRDSECGNSAMDCGFWRLFEKHGFLDVFEVLGVRVIVVWNRAVIEKFGVRSRMSAMCSESEIDVCDRQARCVIRDRCLTIDQRLEVHWLHESRGLGFVV